MAPGRPGIKALTTPIRDPDGSTLTLLINSPRCVECRAYRYAKSIKRRAFVYTQHAEWCTIGKRVKELKDMANND